MARRVGMEVSIAISEAAKLADCDVIAAYPITPQTHIVEHLAEFVANGELDCEFVPCESEHSAISACCGSSAVGARTFTATASQGLALMHEILFIVPALRLPVVMAVANRSLSGPISIWNDHSDVMTERDTGWIQVFAENGQEAFDLMVMAFRIAEDKRVMLPIAVNFDGFVLSHVIEPIELLDQQEVRDFVPPYKTDHILDPANPVSMGPVGIPSIYTETRYVQNQALLNSMSVIEENFAAFNKAFGRKYKPVESYRTDGADVVMITMGGISETAMSYIDGLWEKGQKVGLVRLRVFRPFPFEALREAVAGAKVLVVVDRAVSFGGPVGPLASEIKSALYGTEHQPKVVEFIAGLGGRDVTFEDLGRMIDAGTEVLGGAPIPEYSFLQVRQ